MPPDTDKIARQLSKLVRGDVLADRPHRVLYSTDAGIYRILPACVVLPKDVQDVINTVRYAADEQIPIAPRGAGTGVAGESLCTGILLDISAYLRRIISPCPQDGLITLEPGVVLAQANRTLAPHGLSIGPDPSSANRATIGGCIANNATGAHCLVYGHMSRYVEELEVVLTDGRLVTLRNNVRPDPADTLASACLNLLQSNADLIFKATMKPPRARLGYQLRHAYHDGFIDMARLVTGSEGTLAIITKATIRVVPLPRAKGLLQAAFRSFDQMAQAVPIAVEAGASGCELMDGQLIQMAAEAFCQYRQILPIGATAVLLIELVAEDQRELGDRLTGLEESIRPLAYEIRMIIEQDLQALYWKSRTDAVPLLYRRPGQEKPIPIIEDTTVDHRLLGQYIQGLERISRQFQTPFCYYGHAGDGELHIRPYLDLSRPEDVQKMKAIAKEVFSLVWSLGGSISGEHAYGLLRAGYLRQEFGPEYVGLLQQIKRIFDPQGILNPGKVFREGLDLPTRQIRRSACLIPDRIYTFDNQTRQYIIDCNGCGVCRQDSQQLRICPVYKAMPKEAASPRAKVNIIEAWAAGVLDEAELYDPTVGKILDLCIHCKACSRDCPSGLDVSRMVMMARALRVKRLGLGITERILVYNRILCQAARPFAPFANLIMRSRPGRWLLQAIIGLDGSVSMPTFSWGSLTSKARLLIHTIGPLERPVGRVAYLPDTYVSFYDHQLGLDILRVLRANGLEVVIPTQRPVPAPAIYYGALDRAKAELRHLVRRLWPLVQDGFSIVVSEPTAALVMNRELPILIDDQEARAVASNTYELMEFLHGLMAQGKLMPPRLPYDGHYAYHLPCHGMAIWGEPPAIAILKAAGLDIEPLNAGCCGLAGTYGMQKCHGQLSQAISSVLKARLAQLGQRQVITECSACRTQIANLSNQAQPIHPVSLLARAYRIPEKR